MDARARAGRDADPGPEVHGGRRIQRPAAVLTPRDPAGWVALPFALFDDSSLGFAVLAPDLCVLRANASFATAVSVEPRDLVGRPLGSVAPELARVVASLLQSTGDAGVGRTGPAVALGPRRFRATVAPVRVDEEVVGIAVTLDVPAGVDLGAHTASEARYRTLFEQAPDGILIGTADSVYLDANESACRMLGYAHDELVGLHANDIVAEDHVATIAPALEAIHARQPYHRELAFRRKDGSTFPVEVIASVMPNRQIVGIFRDITERKDAERAMRALNDSLEANVAQRTLELRDAVARAEGADQLKSSFLATMSHELRTPLNSIIGFTGIVLQGLAGPLNAEQTKQLGMVRSSARHLLDLINDVLDLSKIEANQLEVRAEPFALDASVERVLASMRPQAERKGLSIHTTMPSGPILVTSDQRRVEQILLNLIGNAVKFTDRGGVTLTVEVDDMAPTVTIRVADTGIGIAAEHLESLFRPFRQLDAGLSRQREGTGLGLAICRRLATLLGGEISVGSAPDRGSVFTLVLPVPRPAP